MYDLDATYFALDKEFAQAHSSMDAYERYGNHYGSRTDSHSGSQSLRLDGISAQQKLPSFRDIIPAHLHNAIESTPPSATSELHSPDPANSNQQAMLQMSRSVAPSPVQSQVGSVPTMGDGLDDFTNRGTDGFYMAPQQARHMSDHTSPWVPSAQYPEITTAVVPQTPMYQNQIYTASRTSPGLPPLRDAHGRPERLQNGYDSGYGMPVAQYSSMYGQQTTDQSELDQATLGSRRTPQLESSLRHRHPFPPMNRHYSSGPIEYPRYAAGHCDPYRAHTPYQGTYSEHEYPSQSLSGSQHSNYGGLGDSMDSRNKRRRGNLPKQVTDLLKEWLHQHLDHPYPSEEDKQFFIARTGLSISQISNWFINARRRQVPSIRSNRERSSHSTHMDHRGSDRLHSHDPSLSPR